MTDHRADYHREDAKSILQYIYIHYGGNKAFEERGRVIGIFMDLASGQHLRREINVLKLMDSCGVFQQLAQASSLRASEQKKTLQIIRSELVTNRAIDDATVISFLQMMSEVLDWKYKTFQQDALPQAEDFSLQFGAQHKPEPPPPEPQDPDPKQRPAKPPRRKSRPGCLPILIIIVILVVFVRSRLKKPPSSAADSPASTSSEAVSSVSNSEALPEELTLVIPNVINMEEAAARQQLTAEGFTYSIRYQYDASLSSGIVITQTPAAGTQWDGEPIELIICDKSLGMVQVPNVVGMTLSAAQETLTSVGLSVNAAISGNETAVVTSQSPSAGTSLEQGMSVVLSYQKPAASQNQTVQPSSPASSHTTTSSPHETPAETPAATTPPAAQSTQPTPAPQSSSQAPTVSASITESTKNVIQFVTSGGNVTISVEFVYPTGEHSERFPLGTFSDGTHEFSPGVSVTDPEGTYHVYLYDSSGRQLASSTFVN